MSTAVVIVLWIGVTAYVVFGGADFGAGVWDLAAGSEEQGRRPRELIDTSITPVWEANHVWIIFVLVLTWTGFPDAFSSIMSTLWIPFALALVGIIVRGSGFAFRHAVRGHTAWIAGRAFAVASLLTPFCLGAALGGIAAGRVPAYPSSGDPWSSWLNPTSILVGVLAVVTSAYLAAVFLVADADRRADLELKAYFARRALIAAIVAGAVAIAGLFVLRADAPYDGHRLTSAAWPLLVVSAVAGVANLALLRRHGGSWTRAVGVLAVAAVMAGWAVAQSPYLLPTSLTVAAAAASSPTLRWLLIVSGIAAVVVGPSLGLLFTLDRRGLLSEQPPEDVQPVA